MDIAPIDVGPAEIVGASSPGRKTQKKFDRFFLFAIYVIDMIK
jgi:hypothetical protein